MHRMVNSCRLPINLDPAFVATLGVRHVVLPPYNKPIIKHLPRSQLDIIGAAWQIPPLADPNSVRNLINAKFNFKDPQDPHHLENAADPGHVTSI